MNRVSKFLLRQSACRNIAALLFCFSLMLLAAHKTVSVAQGLADGIPLSGKRQEPNYSQLGQQEILLHGRAGLLYAQLPRDAKKMGLMKLRRSQRMMPQQS